MLRLKKWYFVSDDDDDGDDGRPLWTSKRAMIYK
jgi:hypothetical protein